jgi:hypothetical protein
MDIAKEIKEIEDKTGKDIAAFNINIEFYDKEKLVPDSVPKDWK